jgi:pilus assembly protein CpaE
MYSLALGLIIRTNTVWAEINTVLRDLPFRVVADIHQVEDLGLSMAQIAETRPDIVLAEISDNLEDGRELISRIKQASPAALVVAIHPSPGVEMVVTALRAGANEFLHAPLATSLKVFLDNTKSGFNTRQQGTAVGFVSAKGGCGSSTIACHSAVALGARARKPSKVLLMDLDLNTGVDRFILKARSEYSVLDAVKNYQKLDISYWSSLVSRTHAGLDVLAAPAKLNCNEQLKRDEVQYVLSFARRYYSRIVVDLGRGVGQIAAAVLPQLAELYIVATPEIIPLHMTKQMLEALDASGFPRERIRFVLNRVPRSRRGEIRKLETVLGIPVALSLPNDYDSLHECYSYGKLLPESSHVAAAIRSVAAMMTGEHIEPKNIVVRFFQKWTRPCQCRDKTPAVLPVLPICGDVNLGGMR